MVEVFEVFEAFYLGKKIFILRNTNVPISFMIIYEIIIAGPKKGIIANITNTVGNDPPSLLLL